MTGGVNNAVRTGWPRGVPPPTAANTNSFPKNPSLTLNRQINLYPLTNYTFGTKDPLVRPISLTQLSGSTQFLPSFAQSNNQTLVSYIIKVVITLRNNCSLSQHLLNSIYRIQMQLILIWTKISKSRNCQIFKCSRHLKSF